MFRAKLFNTAKEITIAKSQNCDFNDAKSSGENIVYFFETVYNKLIEISNKTDIFAEHNLIAFSSAKEITIAKLQNCGTDTTRVSGESVAKFFEIIFYKLIEIAEKTK